MKKGLIVTLIILVILILVALAIFIIFNKNKVNENISDVTMIIEEGTLTRTSAKIIIKGKNNNISCDQIYHIDKKENGEWKAVTQIDRYSFTLLGMLPDKDGKITDNINWSKLYGELENGEYRLVKSVSTSEGKKELYAEFTIE